MAIRKVTDPAKKTTDPVLLAHFKRAGINKDYVEFVQDYAARGPGRSPYSKRYRDRKSGKNFLVCSGLPMCRADGTKLTPGWKRRGGKFHAKTNLFTGTVEYNGRIALSPTNDQPNGMRTSDTLAWKPQLYLSGIEVSPVVGPVLLPIDPVNSNYLNNTLEWDYGICKRRIRTVQGRLRERWIFTESPGADVRIVHNHTGKGLRLGEYAVDDDVELIPLAIFQQAEYPLEISASATFYPDAHPEEHSVDGWAREYHAAGLDWATLRAAAGDYKADTQTDISFNAFRLNTNDQDNWDLINRSIFLFDTSSLGAGAVVSAATLSFYGTEKKDTLSAAPTTNVYSSAPASNIAIIGADYSSLGSIPFCDTAITYAGFDIAGYNDFVLNAAGISAIDTTGVSKFGVRNANYDASGTTPPYAGKTAHQISQFGVYAAENGSNKPKLVIEYTNDIEKSLSASFEVEASMGRHLRLPLSSLVEMEAVGLMRDFIRTMPVSALVEADVFAFMQFERFISKKHQALYSVLAESSKKHQALYSIWVSEEVTS